MSGSIQQEWALEPEQLRSPSRAVRDADVSQGTYRALIVILTIAASLIRFYHLGDRSLWIDEGASYVLTQLNWAEFFHALRTFMGEMSFYYLLLRLWSVFGTSEFALRAFSVLLSVATVPLIGLLGERLYSRRAGIIAAAIFSFHVWNIHFAREARAYPLLTLMAVIGWLLLTRIVKDPSPTNWILFVVISVFSVYAHFLAALNIAAQFTSLLFILSTRQQYKRLISSAFWIAVLCLPAVSYALRASGGNISWVKPTRITFSGSLTAADHRVENASGNVVYFFDFLSGWWGSPIAIYAFYAVLLALTLLVAWVVLRKGRNPQAWAATVPLLGMLVPFLSLIMISLFQSAFVPRYLAPVTVALALGLGLICDRLRTVPWIIALVVLSAYFLKPLPWYFRQRPYENFRGAAEFIGLRAQPGDILYMWEPFARPTLEFYGRRIPGFPRFAYPKSTGQFRMEDLLQGPDPYHTPAEMASHDRVWIVYNFATPAEEYGVTPFFYQRTAERTNHKLGASFYSENIQVLEYVRAPVMR